MLAPRFMESAKIHWVPLITIDCVVTCPYICAEARLLEVGSQVFDSQISLGLSIPTIHIVHVPVGLCHMAVHPPKNQLTGCRLKLLRVPLGY